MTKRPKRRKHGPREQAKLLRRKRLTTPRRLAQRAAALVKRVEANVQLKHRSNALTEIAHDLHEPRVMTPETRALRRGRRAR